MDILGMNREEVISLAPEGVKRTLTADEVLHIAKVLGGLWRYDYAAMRARRLGMHPILRSGHHSDGFIDSGFFLRPENIRRILSLQMAERIRKTGVLKPDFVAGVPNGATLLASDLAEVIGAGFLLLKKNDDRITLHLGEGTLDGATVLLVEDVISRGASFSGAVLEIERKQLAAEILPFAPVIVSRGGLRRFAVKGIGSFQIVSLAEMKIQSWNPCRCSLCAIGSMAIRPKETEKNWQALISSQLS